MRALRITTLAAAAALVLAGCGGGDDGGDDTAAPSTSESPAAFAEGSRMAELQEGGKLRVGTKFTQPLFGLKGLSGDVEGFDVEVAKIIASKLGLSEDQIEFKETVSAVREDSITGDVVDIIIATYTINDKRDALIDFAGPYVVANQGLLVLEGNPQNISQPEDLAGKVVCTEQGSTSITNIQKLVPTVKVVARGSYADCAVSMQDGTNDIAAVSTDDLILAGIAAQNEGKFEVLDVTFTDEPYGIGLPEGQEDFCEFLNEVIAEAYDDGSLQDAFDKTIGTVVERDLKKPEPFGCDK